MVPLRWTVGDAEEEERGRPIHDDSAGLRVYKEAVTRALSSQRRWPTCSPLPVSCSAAPACYRPRLQVNTLFHGLQSVCFSEKLLTLAYYASYYSSADKDGISVSILSHHDHEPLVYK